MPFFLVMERIAGHDGVGQHFGGLFKKGLANWEFAIVLGSAIGGHGRGTLRHAQRLPRVNRRRRRASESSTRPRRDRRTSRRVAPGPHRRSPPHGGSGSCLTEAQRPAGGGTDLGRLPSTVHRMPNTTGETLQLLGWIDD